MFILSVLGVSLFLPEQPLSEGVLEEKDYFVQ